jgi:exodeoxyribonuclease VII large subunit
MKPITVSKLNQYVSSLLESDPMLSVVCVLGEISSLRKYASGHVYFTLKDEKASVSCVMFKSNAELLPFNPIDGISVSISGKVTLYERDGKYQINVYEMSPDGTGELYTAFERLKEKLLKEGLFDSNIKKKIPLLPRRIGIITSPSGAAIRDVIHVLRRRFSNFNLLLYPVLVQGNQAARQIAGAIEEMNRLEALDVLIVCRGGGSLEDLWCFNEEIVARAVYASKIPIISAVGHETDFTICDFAADVRAPTPSAAAEIVIPQKADLLREISRRKKQLSSLLSHRLKYEQLRLDSLQKKKVLVDPSILFETRKLEVTSLESSITDRFYESLKASKDRLKQCSIKMDHLNPMKVLDRGYALITRIHNGVQQPIRSINQISRGDLLETLIADGSMDCMVVDVKKGVKTYDSEKNK